jgi:four helix bundle protein
MSQQGSEAARQQVGERTSQQGSEVAMKSFRELLVWQKAMELVTFAYRLTSRFPKEELYGLTGQIRRAAISIPSNIAEGYGRNSTADYVRFLRTASGSLYELETQAEIAVNLGYMESEAFARLRDCTSEIGRMLGSLIAKLSKPKVDAQS